MRYKSKQEIRMYIWKIMMERSLAKPPFPIYNRIPNFVGAETASQYIFSLNDYINAQVVKSNPDSPQRVIRERILKDRKILVLASPRLKKGFLVIKPDKYLIGREKYASTIRGGFRFGKITPINSLPPIDFVVEGSVAVSIKCERIGKGEGYAELEYAILRELDLVEEHTPIATTIHDIQIFENLPQDSYDVSLDYIATPTRLITCMYRSRRPSGIYWNQLNIEKISKIPILKSIAKSKNYLLK